MTTQTLLQPFRILVALLCISLSFDVSANGHKVLDVSFHPGDPLITWIPFGGSKTPKDQLIGRTPSSNKSTAGISIESSAIRFRQEFRESPSPAAKQIYSVSNRSVDLTGSIAGNWDDVTGWITFPYSIGDQELSVLVRGFQGTKLSGDEYSFSGWDGEVYWINMGDGTPRLLPSLLINSNFEPLAGDAFTQSGSLYYAGTVLYRQAGVNYSVEEWEDEAAWASLYFVTDANDQVVEVVVDIVDDNGEFIESRIPSAGDQLLTLLQAFNLEEPDTINLFGYTGFKPLSGQLSIEKTHYLPNVDFTDADLLNSAGEPLDTGALKLELIIDASKLNEQDEPEYALSTSQPLGYTWGEARQSLTPNTTTSSGGGSFDWMILLLAGLSSYRFITHRKMKKEAL